MTVTESLIGFEMAEKTNTPKEKSKWKVGEDHEDLSEGGLGKYLPRRRESPSKERDKKKNPLACFLYEGPTPSKGLSQAI
ncbi:hypothetical protein CCACVL1_29309 [Corchorus capsularis]|uniref:Uncharacterized protein n=1 Tax=Corchorus capsularis TaxID=210143 RepID=A0A1R3G299_COCAP|nr:hypothetical protein CCACVL1_29309 [Corchorus capsularis]